MDVWVLYLPDVSIHELQVCVMWHVDISRLCRQKKIRSYINSSDRKEERKSNSRNSSHRREQTAVHVGTIMPKSTQPANLPSRLLLQNICRIKKVGKLQQLKKLLLDYRKF